MNFTYKYYSKLISICQTQNHPYYEVDGGAGIKKEDKTNNVVLPNIFYLEGILPVRNSS